MITVVFHLTDFDPTYGIPSPQNHIHEWIQTCNAFGVDNLIIVDKTQFKIGQYYRNNSFGIDLKVFDSVDEYYNFANNGQQEWVFFESEDSIKEFSNNIHSLQSFNHSENNVYVFGPDVGSLMIPSYKNSTLIFIESNGKFPLYAKCAASIVLHDRYIKNAR